MAVELRCPNCKAKLRLREEPDPDTEVECSKCDHVFVPARATVPPAEDPPRKKKSAAGGADDAPKGKAAGGKPKGPKKRKAKKRKTPPLVIAGIVVGVLMVVGTVGGVFVWYLTKKSSSQEMMSYLPDDCDEVFGLNVGHLQKYPDFYKTCKGTFAEKGFKKAGDVFAAALGHTGEDRFDAAVDYVVEGTGRAGGRADGAPLDATVIKSKAEFDPGAVAKIPGAQKATAGGVDYYRIPDPGLGYGDKGVFVFAPTNRLVVFCRGDLPDAKFKGMLTGNRDNPDATVFVRAGPLAKQTIRGTVWRFTLYGRAYKPLAGRPATPGQPGQQPAGEDPEQLLRQEIAGVLGSAKGTGIKASVGSRDVRGEWVVWYKDSDAASEAVKKWKEKPWVKDDEETPPRYWKSLAGRSGIGKTAENVIRDGLSFRSSGELFSIRTETETKLLQQGVGSLVSAFAAQPDRKD